MLVRFLKLGLYGLVLGVVTGLVIYALSPCMIFKVSSSSMYPTLKEDDYILTHRVSTSSDVLVGDVIVFSLENNPMFLVKRVIASAGDLIAISDGLLIVNGVVTDYTVTNDWDGYVPTGYFYVVGDNYKESFDSRNWESPLVDFSNIIGKRIVGLS